MKRSLYIGLLLLLGPALYAQNETLPGTQEETKPTTRNLIKSNVMVPFFRGINLTYERFIKPDLSFAMSITGIFPHEQYIECPKSMDLRTPAMLHNAHTKGANDDKFFRGTGFERYEGMILNPEVKIFPWKVESSPNDAAFYFSIYGRFTRYRRTLQEEIFLIDRTTPSTGRGVIIEPENRITYMGNALGMAGGFQVKLGKRFLLEPFFGLHFGRSRLNYRISGEGIEEHRHELILHFQENEIYRRGENPRGLKIKEGEVRYYSRFGFSGIRTGIFIAYRF
jgi:hypothetical protein